MKDKIGIPENQKGIGKESDATQEHIISYCGSCRGSMELGGLDSLHILQLIHGKCYYKKDAKKRSDNYGLHNRLEAKRRVSK